MSFSELLSFALAAFLLALTPGPDVLMVLTTAAAKGRQRGLALTLGLSSGVLVHTALVAFGVAALLASDPRALGLLKLFGAGYLLWLAWQSWRHRHQHLNTSQIKKPLTDSTAVNSTDNADNAPFRETADRPLDWYRRGVIMNLSNPKVLLFFLAFLPEFAHPEKPGFTLRVLLLGVIFMLVTVVVFGSVAWLADRGAARFVQNPAFQSRMNVVASAVFVLIAIGLLLG